MTETWIVSLWLERDFTERGEIPSLNNFKVCIRNRPPAKNYHSHQQQNYPVVERASAGTHGGVDVFELPSFSFDPAAGQELDRINSRQNSSVVQKSSLRVEELVHNYLGKIGNNTVRRVVAVPLDDNNEENWADSRGRTLVCVPVYMHDAVIIGNAFYVKLPKLLRKETTDVDPPSRQLLMAIKRWLERKLPTEGFVGMMFERESAASRIVMSTQNPVYLGKNFNFFHNKSLSLESDVSSVSADEVDVTVHHANCLRVILMLYEKFDSIFANPSWRSDAIDDDPPCPYEYVGMPERDPPRRTSSGVSRESLRTPRFPLHYAAQNGDVDKVGELLRGGADPNARDDDMWTPLHLACVRGHLKVVEVLINSPLLTMVNAQNKSGMTPLHYAVLNEQHALVELLTSHASIDVNVANRQGMQPIDFCQHLPKIVELLSNGAYKSKINVDSAIGPFSVKTADPNKATIGEILETLVQELRLTPEQVDVFAIYICSESLSLQLRPEYVASEKLNPEKWRANIKNVTGKNNSEQPRLRLQRNAYSTALLEINSKVCDNAFGLSALFEEAATAFRQGVLISNGSDVPFFAALLARKLHGRGYNPTKYNMANLLPGYVEPTEKVARQISKKLKIIEDMNDTALERRFLTEVQHLKTYGATFFDVEFSRKNDPTLKPALVGINEEGLHIVVKSTRVVKSFAFDEFQPIFSDATTLQVDALQKKGKHYTITSKSVKFLKSLITKFKTLKDAQPTLDNNGRSVTTGNSSTAEHNLSFKFLRFNPFRQPTSSRGPPRQRQSSDHELLATSSDTTAALHRDDVSTHDS